MIPYDATIQKVMALLSAPSLPKVTQCYLLLPNDPMLNLINLCLRIWGLGVRIFPGAPDFNH